jgi:hypothetical protein
MREDAHSFTDFRYSLGADCRGTFAQEGQDSGMPGFVRFTLLTPDKIKSLNPGVVSDGSVIQANEIDFKTEYLDLEMAIKVVDSLEEAIEHINTHGSHHTDCIITESEVNAKRYPNLIKFHVPS